MYFVVNDSIIPKFIALVKKEKIVGLLLRGKGEDVLKNIVKLVQSRNVNWKKMKGIIVISNSLSFTQNRIIVTIINVIGNFFNIPRSLIKPKKEDKIDNLIKNGIKALKKKDILPFYHKKPNITKPK